MQTYIRQNPHFPAERIVSLFRLITSRNGLCLKVVTCTGVVSGLSLTQCSYGQLPSADTFDLYAKLKPELMTAFASELNSG